MYTIKRIYDEPHDDDGYRVLIDRLWPRGVSKERAALDEWCKDLAPSSELRAWFNHDPKKFTEFTKRYIHELHQKNIADIVKDWPKHTRITLLYAAHDPKVNHAFVLQRYLSEHRQ